MRRHRLALRAYPRLVREREGDVLLGLAEDLARDRSSVNREALGLVRGGLLVRAGALARAPWDEALGRLAVPLAIAFTALIWGRAAPVLWSTTPAWPGWGWTLTVVAPVLALGGVLAGRRPPATIGALLLVALGVAQGNSRPVTTVSWFSADLEWAVHGDVAVGYSMAALGCAIPGALLLLAAAARLPHARRATRWSVTAAWTAAISLAALLLGGRHVAVGGLRLDDVGLLLVGYGAAVTGFTAVVLAGPARRDPASLLAALLAAATTAPVVALLVVASLPAPDAAILALLGVSALGGCAALLRGAAAIARR